MQLVLSLHNNTSFCKNKALLKVCICQTFAFAKSHGWSRTLSGTKSDWLKEKMLQSYGNGQEAANEIVSVWYWIISTVSQWSNLKMTILYTLSIKRLPVPPDMRSLSKRVFSPKLQENSWSALVWILRHLKDTLNITVPSFYRNVLLG